MNLLIINTLPEDDVDAIEAIRKLIEISDDVKVVNTCEMNIMHCTGCKSCMFQTPGRCCLKDDYNVITKLFLEYNNVIVLTDTSLNFLDYKVMRLFERRFSSVAIFCEFRDNNVRHITRCERKIRLGILYKGELNNSLLNEWLNLYTDHLNDTPLGAFNICSVEEICKCVLQ